MCSVTVETPRVMRSEPRAQSLDKPIAVSTSDGSGLPVLQADPEEQAKPSMSRRRNSAFPSAC